MKRSYPLAFAVFVLFAAMAQGQNAAPLKLVDTFKFPSDIKGHFDHLGIDLQGHRLFATAEGAKAVIVFDLRTGNVIHTMSGIERPHAVLYRNDLKRLYITDGSAGDLKIFDGNSYRLLESVKLLADADSIGYDPVSKYLYVEDGGGDVHETYSMFSIIDTTAGRKLADIKIEGDTLEAMALEKSSPLIYFNNRAKNQIEVFDRKTRQIIASWPVTRGKFNVAISLDEPHHRLFVGCRSGDIVVFDTQTGRELSALPINKGVDDLVYDPVGKRLYAACGEGDGSVDVYEETDPDHYQSLGKVSSGPAGRTARLVPELNRYFVAVPAHGSTNAEVMVFQLQ